MRPHLPRHIAFALGVPLLLSCSSGTTGTQVVDPVATTLTITPDAVAFSYLGEARALSARITDQDGRPFSAPITWSSSDASVVSVSSEGLAAAVANGSAVVTASAAGLSATLTIEVQQVPQILQVVQGADQDAVAGAELPDSLVIQVTDLGSAPVEGSVVTFLPDSVSGTVSADSLITGTDGRVVVAWTLGAGFGCQSMSVSAGPLSEVVRAFGGSGSPIPDLVVVGGSGPSFGGRACTSGTPGLSRADPTTQDTVRVTVRVLNQGDAATGSPFDVTLLANGSPVVTENVPALDVGEEVLVELVAGLLAAGAQTLTVQLDAGGDVAELIEGNNSVERPVVVLDQAAFSVGTPVTGLSAAVGEELLFVLEVPPGSADALTIEVTDASPGANDDLDLFVAQGNRPVRREDYPDCISSGPTTAERCQIVFPGGTYHVLLHAWEDDSGQFNPTGFTDVTLTATLGGTIIPYNIELVFLDNGTPTQDQAFRDAAARWEQIIRGDIPDQDFTGNPVPADACFQGQPEVNDVVDDVRIYVTITGIDGAGGTLAQAGPCATRGLNDLPIFGAMTFDEADLINLEGDGDVFPVVLHEMAHVLGLGTIWSAKGLLQAPSLPNNQGADTHFSGDGAIEAFDAAGGANYPDSKVPVENQAGPGSGDAHWRESVMDRELMTPFLEAAQVKPLSAITIRSMEDLGYGVDISQADPYSVPAFPLALAAPGSGRFIDLGDDIRKGPIAVIDSKGRITEIRR